MVFLDRGGWEVFNISPSLSNDHDDLDVVDEYPDSNPSVGHAIAQVSQSAAVAQGEFAEPIDVSVRMRYLLSNRAMGPSFAQAA